MADILEKANDRMRKIYLLLTVILFGFGGVATAQNNPPQFDTIFTTGTVTEGDLLSWDIIVSDLDPGDIITVATDPPLSDPLYQGAVFVFEIEPRIWNFQFNPDYDFIGGGQVDVPLTIVATDGIDTAFMPVTITVVHYNPPPRFIGQPGNRRTADGIPVQIDVIASDSDLTVPALTAEPVAPALPNAAFTPTGDGTGIFEFTPDATQTGQDYTITFVASDGEKADTVFSMITVVDYLPATLDAIPTQIAVEGEQLEFYITGNSPIDIDFPLELSAVENPALKYEIVDHTEDSVLFRLFEDSNYVKQDVAHDLIYYAYNGRDTTFDTAVVTITDSMNFPPVFETIEPYTIREGVEEVYDTLVARDPEGNPVALSFFSPDTVGLENLSLEKIGPDSALLRFSPDFTQGYLSYGGDYIFRVLANDFLDGETDAAVDTADIRITVNEVDFPPVLELDTTGFVGGLPEGGFVRYDIVAYDMLDSVTAIPNEFTIFPPPDSEVYKGNVVFVDNGDGTGIFEFYPDYSQVSVGSDTTYQIIFTTADSIETVEVPVIVTVYNIEKSKNDPFDADTLTLVASLWDTVIITDTIPIETLGNDSIVVDTSLGFSFTTRIWNDSNLTAAMTGFRWFAPWLKLDKVLFGPRLVSGPDPVHFTRVHSEPDSLAFQATFIYLEGKSIAPDPSGSWEHLRADFYIDPEMIDLDAIDLDSLMRALPKIYFDTVSLGSASRFVFDKQPKWATSEKAIEQYLRLLKTSDLTYPPLVKLGEVRPVDNAVKMTVFDVSNGTTLGNGSSLYLYDEDDSVNQYELRISVENQHRLSELSLGLRISSDDSALWFYGDTASIVVASSRMAPDTGIWTETGGLNLTGSSIDGASADTLALNGKAGAIPDAGLPAGLMEFMIRVPFTVSGVIRGETKVICFDTLATGGGEAVWFVESTGDTIIPPFSGGMCFPVRVSRVLKAEADSVVMHVYDVDADTALGANDVLYMKDENDSTKQYEIRLSLENLRRLIELSLGLRVYSEDGAQWAYGETAKPTVLSGSRMAPDSVIWNQTIGLIYADASMQNADGMLEDTLELEGASSQFTQFGLQPGFLETMVSIPFTITGVGEGDEKTLCFDTTATDSGNAWRYVRIKVDTLSQDSVVQDTTIIDTIGPGFSGAICLAVRYKKPTGADDELPVTPVLYSLEQNHPNPFNAGTTIRFRIGSRERVRITVYNILGQTVVTLTDEVYPPGIHEVVWDGRDRGGRPTASGVYLYHIASEGIRQTRKMILLK